MRLPVTVQRWGLYFEENEEGSKSPYCFGLTISCLRASMAACVLQHWDKAEIWCPDASG